MNGYYAASVQNRIQPVVQDMVVSEGICRLDSALEFNLYANACVDDSEAVKLCKSYWQLDCKIKKNALDREIPAEGYELEVAPGKLDVYCADRSGLLNAFKSMRMLAETERGVLISTQWQLPCVKIKDAPRFAFRGLHICYFPETESWQIEKYIRIAAAMKFNYLVLESWGRIKFKSHPEFCFSEYAVDPQQIRDFVKLGKELGITLVPQFGIFGHAAMARCCGGKHALLNEHPEYAPLFEPDGWSWCLSNPVTRQYLEDIVLELCDIFDNPPYFHIGCDEAYNAGSCSLCADGFEKKLEEHIIYFHNLLKSRNSKTLMWHDMLLVQGTPEYRGFRAYGSERTRNLYKALPRDIMLCDWEYNYGVPDYDPEWPTVKFFKEQGFDIILCPWKDAAFTKDLGNQADKHNLEGILGTTWHHFRAGTFSVILKSASQAAWAPDKATPPHVVPREYINMLLRYIDKDMNMQTYDRFGNIAKQFSVDTVN